jgi:hypothetical protein
MRFHHVVASVGLGVAAGPASAHVGGIEITAPLVSSGLGVACGALALLLPRRRQVLLPTGIAVALLAVLVWSFSVSSEVHWGMAAVGLLGLAFGALYSLFLAGFGLAFLGLPVIRRHFITWRRLRELSRTGK